MCKIEQKSPHSFLVVLAWLFGISEGERVERIPSRGCPLSELCQIFRHVQQEDAINLYDAIFFLRALERDSVMPSSCSNGGMWDYALPPDFTQPKRSMNDVPKMCCAVIGFVALIIIVSMYHMKSTNPGDCKGRMIPVFVSSMASVASSAADKVKEAVTSTINMATEGEDEYVPPTTAKNLTFCAKGSKCEADDKTMKTMEKNVTDYMEENPDAVLMIFAPWCGHCKSAIPEFCKANDLCTKKMAIINSSMVSQEFLTKNFNLTHFPFIIKKQGEKTEVFQGKATAENIKSFAEKDELQMMF